MTIITNTTDQINRTIPSDPTEANTFDKALNCVYGKYTAGEPLTRRELLRLSQACIKLIGKEGCR